MDVLRKQKTLEARDRNTIPAQEQEPKVQGQKDTTKGGVADHELSRNPVRISEMCRGSFWDLLVCCWGEPFGGGKRENEPVCYHWV